MFSMFRRSRTTAAVQCAPQEDVMMMEQVEVESVEELSDVGPELGADGLTEEQQEYFEIVKDDEIDSVKVNIFLFFKFQCCESRPLVDRKD